MTEKYKEQVQRGYHLDSLHRHTQIPSVRSLDTSAFEPLTPSSMAMMLVRAAAICRRPIRMVMSCPPARAKRGPRRVVMRVRDHILELRRR